MLLTCFVLVDWFDFLQSLLYFRELPLNTLKKSLDFPVWTSVIISIHHNTAFVMFVVRCRVFFIVRQLFRIRISWFRSRDRYEQNAPSKGHESESHVSRSTLASIEYMNGDVEVNSATDITSSYCLHKLCFRLRFIFHVSLAANGLMS